LPGTAGMTHTRSQIAWPVMPEELTQSSAEHVVKHSCKLLSRRAFSVDAK